MKTFILVLFHPVKTFVELKTADKFSKMSLIILLFLIFLNLILMIPFTEKIVFMTYSSIDLPENQQETMMQIVHKMRYLQIVGTVILDFIMFLFYALLLCVLIRLVKAKLTYKSALQLIVYSYFIAVVGDLTNTVLLYVRGLDDIQNMYDTSLLGLNMLTSVEKVGATFYVFLSCFTPFQLIFVFILSIGLKVFIDAKYVKTLIIAILLWLTTTLIPTLSVYFSELSATNSEII
jgi:hypothetical protein